MKEIYQLFSPKEASTLFERAGETEKVKDRDRENFESSCLYCSVNSFFKTREL